MVNLDSFGFDGCPHGRSGLNRSGLGHRPGVMISVWIGPPVGAGGRGFLNDAAVFVESLPLSGLMSCLASPRLGLAMWQSTNAAVSGNIDRIRTSRRCSWPYSRLTGPS